jgi:hypothetical protein
MNHVPTVLLDEIRTALALGRVVPYLGPGLLAEGAPVPASPEALATLITAKVSVPHKIRKRLTAAAQFIENFKHRKTLVNLLNTAFAPPVLPVPLLQWLATHPEVVLLVDSWYDSSARRAFKARGDWGEVQGLSQAEHFGTWFGWYDADGNAATATQAAGWNSLLYKPIGSVVPGANYLVSDSDYVEVLTEIDIQTPIPQEVQTRRSGSGFLFLGCRFTEQLQRSFARQIMKRSSDRHWAVLPGELTRNEARFLTEQGIARLDLSLEEFAALFMPQGAVGARVAHAPVPEQLAGSLAS